MKEILDCNYNRFGITQLNENEITRLVARMKENGIKCSKYNNSITIALTYENIKFVCLSYDPGGIEKLSPQICAAIFPDKIIFANCFSGRGEKRYLTGKIAETTGNKNLDELFSQMAYYSPLYEESSFRWLIEKQSDGSEAFYEYGEEFEKLRCEIIEYEYEMQKKYLTEKTVRPY